MTVNFQKYIVSPLNDAKDWMYSEVLLLADYLWTLTDSIGSEIDRLDEKIDGIGDGGITHDSLSGVTPDQHHPQIHSYNSHTDIPTSFPPGAHTHLENEIIDLDKYTRREVDALLSKKSATYEDFSVSPELVDGDIWVQKGSEAITLGDVIPDMAATVAVVLSYDVSSHFIGEVESYVLNGASPWLIILDDGRLDGAPVNTEPDFTVTVTATNPVGSITSNSFTISVSA